MQADHLQQVSDPTPSGVLAHTTLPTDVQRAGDTKPEVTQIGVVQTDFKAAGKNATATVQGCDRVFDVNMIDAIRERSNKLNRIHALPQ